MGDDVVRMWTESETEVQFLERLLRVIEGGGSDLGTGRIHTLHVDIYARPEGLG
jgi:hypothetical protein